MAIDIAGAFDRVSHVGLLNKAERVGIGGPLLSWLRDYLSNLCLKVVTGGHASKKYPITAGVPQGSVLGPTHFILFASDIDQCLSHGVKLSSFADDTTVYSLIRPNDNLQEKAASLETTLSNLAAWGQQWRIQFEPTKSQRLILCNARKRPDFPPATFAGEIIADSDHLKLLGVTFDSKLGFQRHIHAVAVKASQRLGFLRRAAWLLVHEGRVAVYKGFIWPILEYAPLQSVSKRFAILGIARGVWRLTV